jgi:hypothetical protein
MLNKKTVKKLIPTFIANPKGHPSTGKTAEKLRKEHLRWRTEIQSNKAKKASDNQVSYWSKMSAAVSF